MNILPQLQAIDDLIGTHTRPPVTAMLRNKLSPIIDQAEKYFEAVAKQDETLAAQIKMIERLTAENKKLVKENEVLIAKNQQSLKNSFNQLGKRAHNLNHGRDLKY